jgi:hypothetical protein
VAEEIMAEKTCCWCGEGLGYESTDREPDTCGKRECTREMNNLIRGEHEERQERAMEDDFSRY